jgi:hypothetical protein
MPEVTYTGTFTDPYDSSTSTETITVSAFNMGIDLALKYYFRFTEDFSFYVGGRGVWEIWLTTLNSTDSGYSLYDYDANIRGLLPLGDGMIINASVLFGLRWDSVMPVELFGMFTPVGPGGSPMLSAGLKWHVLSTGRVSVYSKNCEYF